MLSSSEGVLALLGENDYELKKLALQKLDSLTNTFWYEIAGSLADIEKLADLQDFPYRKLSALVCSKIHYHLQSFDDAVTYAFMAEDLFKVGECSLFTETIAGKCIDMYSAIRQNKLPKPDEGTLPKLKYIVECMFQRCLKDAKFEQALGIAIEVRDIVMLKTTIQHFCVIPVDRNNQRDHLLQHTYNMLLSVSTDKSFFESTLKALETFILDAPQRNHFLLFKCAFKLNDVDRIVSEFTVLSSHNDTVLLAYQLAFDLQDCLTYSNSVVIINSLKLTSTADQSENSPIDRICRILDGSVADRFYLQFMVNNSREESQTLLQFAQMRSVDSVCNTAIVIANAFINYGSTSDYLFRNMSDWVTRFTNWSRFIAIGSLGVIHKSNNDNAMFTLDEYLPKDHVNTSQFAVGGALYALGLIYCGRGGDIFDYLHKHFNENQSSCIRHGAALGIGLAGIGSGNQTVIDSLLTPIHSDPVVGEAAAISLGMILLGTQNEHIMSTLLSIAAVNEHEKTLRGVAIALALIVYGRGNAVDDHINLLIAHQEPIHRWSGMYSIAMAYCGTADDEAVRKLLNAIVTDVNDDVRRAAAISLGFVLHRVPAVCLNVIKSLVDSYNPHVRYGSAMALGIAYAGTGNEDACKVLESLWYDKASFVRQAAYIAGGMVLIQQTGVNTTYQKYIKIITQVISDKHEGVLNKFGATIGLGIAYAGSGNVTIKLENDDGHENFKAIVGLLVFQQFWFWFPLSLTLSLAFSPTGMIVLNEDFKMPAIEILSNANPSKFNYIPLVVDKRTRHKSHLIKSNMGTSRLQRRKIERIQANASTSKDSVKENVTDTSKEITGIVQITPTEQSTIIEALDEDFTLLKNPARVVPKQRSCISMANQPVRYQLIKNITEGGSIFMAKDVDPDGDECYVQFMPTVVPKAAGNAEDDEPQPPEPFELPEN